MPNIKSKKQNLTPEEQVSLHLSLQGRGGIPFDTEPERVSSSDDFLTNHLMRLFGDGKETISFARMSPNLVTRNDFFFSEADKPLRGWKLDVVSYDGKPEDCTAEAVALEFVRARGDGEERVKKLLSDLPESDVVLVGTLVNETLEYISELRRESEDGDEEGEFGYDDYITDIDGEPVYSAGEYCDRTYDIVSGKIEEAYEEALRLLGDFVHENDNDVITGVLPIDTVREITLDATGRHPKIFEIVGLARLRETGELAVLMHNYSERNIRCRKGEWVEPLSHFSAGAVLKILNEMELMLLGDGEEEEDEDEDEEQETVTSCC